MLWFLSIWAGLPPHPTPTHVSMNSPRLLLAHPGPCLTELLHSCRFLSPCVLAPKALVAGETPNPLV